MSEMQELSSLVTDPANCRIHSEKNLDMIQSSLQELGAGRSILIDENDVILAGNGVAEAAQRAGLTRVQIVEADGDAVIAVRRSNLTPEQKARLALFDNRASDLSSFDPLMLAGLQAEGVSLDGLWTGDELDALLADLPPMDELTEEMTAERGVASDRQASHVQDSSVQDSSVQDSSVQDREVSPRPPSADTHPLRPEPDAPPASVPVPGLDRVTSNMDRVTPDQETSRAGLFLHFRGLKIPLSAEEGAALDARLAHHRETAGTYYGFIDALLTPTSAVAEGGAA